MSKLYLENENGYVHRTIASQKLGRPLKSTEFVHHIDGDKTNNNLDNLIVFCSNSAHIRYHHGGKIIKLNDGTYDCESIRKNCIVCGKSLDYKNRSGCCKTHYDIAQRKVKNRPSNEELLTLLKSNSKCAVGRMYGVTSSTIKKWLKI